MGNSQTKETRGHGGSHSRHDSGNASPNPNRDVAISEPASRPPRPRRGSRPDFTSFLGIGGSSEQDTMTLEQRREAKLEREAKKLEKERQTRLKERERSMREEHVDGGYLVTQGVYVGVEDYHKGVVRSLMIERRLAPFWRGLNDYSEAWAEHQLMAAARGFPIPPADHVPPELEYSWTKKPSAESSKEKVKGMMIPIASRSQSFQSEHGLQLSPVNNSLPLPSSMAPSNPSPPTGPLFRTRARTLASLTSSSRSNDQKESLPKEFQLPPDPFVNGQPIEVYLYKDASECPICFLYYPPYLNTTRCCEQPICSECFVQIKRPDPHPPEHEQPDPNAAQQMSEEDQRAQAEGLLVSEVATCPYCKQPEFGITYSAPAFRRGLVHSTNAQQPFQAMSAMSSQTSISSGQMSPGSGRRRGTSLSATAPEVITTDKVRPDWASKLATARAHAARRSAAASALHAAAYLMNGQTDRPAFPPFGRRTMLRRPPFEVDDRSQQAQRGMDSLREAGIFLPPPRDSSSRRNRIDDLEEMMISEAIRLSIAAEEERMRKEEKEAKKKAKKEEKEQKKADKAVRKNHVSIGPATSADASATFSRTQEDTLSGSLDDVVIATGKGKAIERGGLEADESEASLEEEMLGGGGGSLSTDRESTSAGMPIPSSSEPFKRSHLRQMSNASSAASSFVEAGTSFPGSGTPTGNPTLEPLFNFRSLTAMISESENEKEGGNSHIEHADDSIGRQGSFENLEDRPSPRSQSSSTTGNETAADAGTLDKHLHAAYEPAATKSNEEAESAK